MSHLTAEPLQFLRGGSLPIPSNWTEAFFLWVHEAGNPFYDWLYGSPRKTRRILHSLLQRENSELWIGHATFLLNGNTPIGAYIGTPGELLARRATADLLALTAGVPTPERRAYSERLKSAFTVFPRVEPDALFLSTIGVDKDYRGRRFGKRLVEEYLADGRRNGFTKFRLNVHAENHAAVALYRSVGFMETDSFQAGDGSFNYLAMVLNHPGQGVARK